MIRVWQINNGAIKAKKTQLIVPKITFDAEADIVLKFREKMSLMFL